MSQIKKWVFPFVILTVLGVCFILPPLFHLNIKPNQYSPGFLPLRIINADLKFLVVLGSMSLFTGIVFTRLHIQGKLKKIPNVLLIFGGIFLASVFVSTVISHNPMRAWISSLQWHLVPLLFVICLSQISWNRSLLIAVLSLLLVGGVASSLVTMDQHYMWTDWSHKVVRTGYSGLIYNHNFAAEYHAPLIPLALGLFSYCRNWWGKGICLFIIFAIFLPTISLSMARGAWVGHIGGTVGAVIAFLVVTRSTKNPTNEKCTIKPFVKGGVLLCSFLILGALLPCFLYTSDFWKKGGVGWDRLEQNEQAEVINLQADVLATAGNNLPKVEEATKAPVFVETRESYELESITDIGGSYSIQRRLVLWEDAVKECFSDDFFFGKGTDHYELFYHESAKLSDQNWGSTLVRFVHNDFIQIFYENGIFGIISWLGIWGIICWQGLVHCVSFFRSGQTSELGIRIALIACIFCFLIEAFFEFPTRSPCAMFVGWSALGVLLGLNLSKPTGKSVPETSGLRGKPVFNLAIGVVGVVLPIYAFFLVKDLFWANVFHYQGRAAADEKKPQLSLHFHREAISFAPWHHRSRKAESYLLITNEKRFLDAMKSVEDTLKVHPGCLQAHQNRIALLINEFKNPQAAKLAFLDMKSAAPFHQFTHAEQRKIKKLFSPN